MTWPPVPPPAIMTRMPSVDLPGETQQHTNAGQCNEERGSAIGNEGQRDAFCRNQREHHTYVEKGLDEDGGGDAEGEKAGEHILRHTGRTQPSEPQGDKQGDFDKNSNKHFVFDEIFNGKIWMR